MKQSRTMSLVESLTNVAVGYGIAAGTQASAQPVSMLRGNVARRTRTER